MSATFEAPDLFAGADWAEALVPGLAGARRRTARDAWLDKLAAVAERVDRWEVTSGLVDRRDPQRALMFLLGVHRGRWLETRHGLPGVPMFLSANVLAEYKRRGEAFPKLNAPYWGLDSGGFTELSDHGTWRKDADEYGGMVTRFIEDVGAPPVFASPQDWMCEAVVVNGGTFKGRRFVGTGLKVRDHLELTVENYCYLRDEFPFVDWAAVLQGDELEDYQLCEDLYRAAGVDLTQVPVVGLGSVCRRQATREIGEIVSLFHRRGYRLHGYGVKADGLRLYGDMLHSADSMAWSFGARMEDLHLPGCTHPGPCNNCYRWALVWRELVLEAFREARRTYSPERLGAGAAHRPDPWGPVLAALLGTG